MDRKTFFFTMDVEQQADDVRLDADRQKLDYENFTKGTRMSQIFRVRIFVMDWIHNEKTGYFRQSLFMGLARPGRITRERPPLIDDQTGVMDLEAAGGTGGWQVEHHGFQAPLLSQ